MATTTTTTRTSQSIKPTDESRNATARSKPEHPQITLSPTLFSLLSLDTPADQIESLCLIKPNSDARYGSQVPRNDKYLIHSAQVGDGNDLAHLQLENCSHLLMFFAGGMEVTFVAAEGQDEDGGDDGGTLTRKAVDGNAEESFGVLSADSEGGRPRIRTYANVEDMLQNHNGSKIRWGFAQDFADQLPYVIRPELIYKLNSKRWLAECELKSANDQIIGCEVVCSGTTENKAWFYHGDNCKGCKAGIKGEVERVSKILRDARVPYVLKLTQSLSSVGTNIVQSDKERNDLVDKISTYLQEYLPRITTSNIHLCTSTLILSDFVKSDTTALNFHVRKSGEVVFLGACRQLATGDSGRQTTAIVYAEQDEMEKKYRAVLARIGKVLKQEGYWGPVGADVMEREDTGEQFVIDLNVRTPLSLVLYSLRGYFRDKHGLGMAVVYECVMLNIDRVELIGIFERELGEGRIVLLGSTRLGAKKQWAYGMVVAGRDKEEIDTLSERIFEWEVKEEEKADADA